jgi:hypothetical protein
LQFAFAFSFAVIAFVSSLRFFEAIAQRSGERLDVVIILVSNLVERISKDIHDRTSMVSMVEIVVAIRPCACRGHF